MTLLSYKVTYNYSGFRILPILKVPAMRLFSAAIAGALVIGALPLAAQIATAPTRTARAIPPRTPPLLPGTRASVFSTIQGNALSETNASLSNAVVRLRDARLGQVVDTQTTDKAGLFTFRRLEPGSY